MKRKQLLMKLMLAVTLMGVGSVSAWADTTVGATDFTTVYLGAKSKAYAINSNGTWTFEFINHNNEGGDYANFLLECNNGTGDEFVLRADNFEVVRWANNDITSTYAGSDLDKDLNGASVVMTVTRNGYHIAVSATITPTTETAAFTYTYNFYRASGNLNLYLSVEKSYITITSVSWEASDGTITETAAFSCDFENSETLFTNASDVSGRSLTISNTALGETDAVLGSHVLTITTPNNSINGWSRAKYDISSYTDGATTVKISFDIYLESTRPTYGKYFSIRQDAATHTKCYYSSTGAIFNVGEVCTSSTSALYYSLMGGNTSTTLTDVMDAWNHVDVTMNISDKTLSYTVKNLAQTTTYYKAFDVAWVDASNATTANILELFACQNNATEKLDNIVITKYVDNSKVATKYTVKYQNAGGTDLKDAVEYDIYAGDTYTASASDMATFYSADTNTKYIYKSGNTSTKAVETAASNVITLVFDEYAKVAYTVTAKNGDATLGVLASGDAYTDGSTTVYWNKYKKYDSQWYVTTGSYGKAITEAGNTDVAYSASDITYFSETEDLTKSHSAASNKTGTGFSNGEAQRHYLSSTWYTAAFEDGGIYTLSFPYQLNSTSGSTIYIGTCDEDGSNFVSAETFTLANNSPASTYSKAITIPAGKALAIQANEYNSNILIDYLTLTAITSVSKTITAAGWATYCSPYALDLENATGLTDAYIVTGGANSVLAKTSVKDGTVAANTGLLLKGSAGTATIPVVASGTDHSATNKLVGVTTATQIAAEAGYVLMNDATYGVAFYKNSNAFTVGANTAYLPANFDGSNAPAWFFSFEDSETTGIDMVHGSGLKVNGSVYNLNGQRVAQPTKGLYIVSGKKVVLK